MREDLRAIRLVIGFDPKQCRLEALGRGHEQKQDLMYSQN